VHRIGLSLGLTIGLLAVGPVETQPVVRASPKVRALLAEMPLERQAAQLVMPWLLGNFVAFDAEGLEQARAWVDSLHVGGIVISIGSPLDVAAKLNFLQRRSRVPLLIAADLESGAAFRFPGATPFPTNMGVAATGREQDAYQMGRISGREGRAVGVHLTFAPVADVNNNPDNPIINTRSFGSDPATVGRFVAATIRGAKSVGMLTVAKHFPGHGDTETDSHLSLPFIRADWARLDRLELVPFRAAIKAGVDGIMSAHLALPRLDPDTARPATLSPLVMTTVLRDSLRFRGLVVTDALDMGALVVNYGGGEAAVRAFLAGSDLLLMPADPRVAIASIANAVRSGRIPRARLRASVTRVLAMKERLGLFQQRTVSLEGIGAVVARQASIDTARAITARSLVLVRDSGGAMDRLRQGPTDLSVVTFGEPGWVTSFPQELRKLGHRTAGFRLYPSSGPASYDSARVTLNRNPTAVFSVAVRVTSGGGPLAIPPGLAALLDESSQLRPTVVVSFGSPYLASQARSAHALLLAWTANPLTEPAAALALSGAPISGRLPIDLPPGYRIGDGLSRPASARYAVAR
jgi:beta-N-acetylhexosaminidase